MDKIKIQTGANLSRLLQSTVNIPQAFTELVKNSIQNFATFTKINLFDDSAVIVDDGQGFDHEVIPHALGVRLLGERTSENGHLTVWHTHGDEVEFRRNGFKSGACSTNSSITPQPVAESVTSLLPMILHQRPASVALIGDDTGAGLQAICEFPVDTVAAFRVDQAATADRETQQPLAPGDRRAQHFRILTRPMPHQRWQQ